MTDFVRVTPEGNFSLEGKRWYCNSAIYFGHQPGAMNDWLRDDVWPINEPLLEKDFSLMEKIGINHAALFLTNKAFFASGKPVQKSFDRLDRVLQVAKQHAVRLTFFSGPFIDTPQEFQLITGKPWSGGDHWLPSFNEELFQAYVQQMRPFAERYGNDPWVMGYGDRIDRFHKGFDNLSIPFNLKEEWAAYLKTRYGSFANLLEAVGGPDALDNRPRDFHEVQLPQESRHNASLKNPLAWDYVLWQKSTIGNTQARWDSEMLKLAPNQVMWTPFEGCTLDWAMLDGFTPETQKLHAIWMEYYHWQAVRTQPVQDWSEWAHTREFATQRLHHKSPTIYNSAYAITRYVKQSVRRPVVICHGVRMDAPFSGADTQTHQLAMMDRLNAACIAADGDGWHYWSWTDDWESSMAHRAAQQANPEHMYFQGETMGLLDSEGHPRPFVTLAGQYSRQLQRMSERNVSRPQSEVLLLSSSPRMYNLFRRMAFPTASAVCGALLRLGAQPDYLWTSQNDIRITQEQLNAYKLIVIADNMYERDFRTMPDMLLQYVQQGGTLYFALDRFDRFRDEHGVVFESAAMRQLSGVDPAGAKDWPGASVPCQNWPFESDKAHEPNWDVAAFPRVHYGICPEFRHRAPHATMQQLLGLRSYDDDTLTNVPGVVKSAEVIALAKFAPGSKPLYFRHRIGKGTVYVNTWTNNIFRDTHYKLDHGGWEWDFFLDLALESAKVQDIDLTRGAGLWLRQTWGYFWNEM